MKPFNCLVLPPSVKISFPVEESSFVIEAVCYLVSYDNPDTAVVETSGKISVVERWLENTGWKHCKKDKRLSGSCQERTSRHVRTYLVLVTTVISIDHSWRGVPQSFVNRTAESVLFNSRQMLKNVQSVLEVFFRADDHL